jgi:hypothetical protein
MDMFYETVYEAIEFQPGVLQRAYDDEVCPIDLLKYKPHEEWRGPISMHLIDKCRNAKNIFVGGFGQCHTATKIAKKYEYLCEFVCLVCNETRWHYKHCSGRHEILIRRVEPPPEIHLVMAPRGGRPSVRRAAKGGYYRPKQNSCPMNVTAVAANGKTVLEMVVTHDVRFQQFKADVKTQCIKEKLCTMQTDLQVLYENFPMSCLTFLRKDCDANRKRRLPKVIIGKFSSGWHDQNAPQSRQAMDVDDGDDSPAVDDDGRAKKQKTAVADLSSASKDLASSAVPNPCVRPVARPSASSIPRPSRAPHRAW